MASYFVLYRADDPAGEILSVAFVEQEEADAALVSDPSLAYVVASSNIDKTAYYITVGPPRALSLKPPVVPAIMYRGFYKLAFNPTTFVSAGLLSKLEADLMIAGDTTLAYISSMSEINPATQYVSGGVLTNMATFTVTFDTYSIPNNGTSAATLTSTLPSATTITLVGDSYVADKKIEYGIATQSQVYNSGAFTLTSTVKGPHVLRFEKAYYITKEVTINVV